MAKAITHRKGEVVDVLPDGAEKVNALKDTLLDVEYYVSQGHLYKKQPNGKFRALVKQEQNPGFVHFFVRERNAKRKITVSVRKMNELHYVDEKKDESVKEELEKESESESTSSENQIKELKAETISLKPELSVYRCPCCNTLLTLELP
jgi:hypothetical protein